MFSDTLLCVIIYLVGNAGGLENMQVGKIQFFLWLLLVFLEICNFVKFKFWLHQPKKKVVVTYYKETWMWKMIHNAKFCVIMANLVGGFCYRWFCLPDDVFYKVLWTLLTLCRSYNLSSCIILTINLVHMYTVICHIYYERERIQIMYILKR